MSVILGTSLPSGFQVDLKDSKGKVVATVNLAQGQALSSTLTKTVQVKSVTATPTEAI